MTKAAAEKDFDYILEHIVGGGGWWQWKRILFLVPQSVTNGLPLLLHMFTAYTPKHRCYIEGCDLSSSSPSPFTSDYLNFTTPKAASGDNFLSESEAFDTCSMFLRGNHSNSSEGQCRREDFGTVAANCSRFVYDTSEFSETLTTKLDLVCSRVELQHFLSSVMMFGLLLGSLLGGPIGDRFGRRAAMFGGMSVAVPCVFLGAAVDHYLPYAVLRLATCTVIVFSWIAAHNFQLEYFGKAHRRTVYTANLTLQQATNYLLPLLMYFNRDWRSMHVSAGAVALLAFPTYFVLPESMRWLVCNHRVKEAHKILREVADGNGRTITDAQKLEMHQILRKLSEEARFAREGDNLGICDMLGSALRKRTLILFCCWVCNIVGFYALLLNVGDLSGDIFVNFVISISADIPANLSVFFVVDRYGRRKCLFASLFGLGFFCLVMAFIPKDNRTLVLAIYLVSKYCAGLAGSICWLYTAELYPTNLRSQAVGTCSMVSRLFGTTSTFLPELAKIWPPLPMVLLGIPSLVSAFMALSLPETTGQPLPQNLEEALTIGLKVQDGDLPMRPRQQQVDVILSSSSEDDVDEDGRTYLEKDKLLGSQEEL